MAIVPMIALILLIFFTGYTLYALKNESFWMSLRAALTLRWGKQIILDLYLGLFLFSWLIYMHEGSWLVTIAWTLASVIFGNIATLIYFILNYQGLIAHFS